jgi:hypothetical protein
MTLSNPQASYNTALKKLTVTGIAPISSTVRVLVNPNLGSYTTGQQIYTHYDEIPALAKKQGHGGGDLAFTIEFQSIPTVPSKVVLVTSDFKEEEPLVTVPDVT